MSLKTWMSANEDSVDIRKVDVLLSGFCIDLRRSTDTDLSENNLMSKVDIGLDVEFSSVASAIRCRLSNVMTRLSYRDYVALRCIIRDNIGRKTDRDHWDNLETAWEKESKATEPFDHDSLKYSVDVAYSSSARVVRYGQEKRSRTISLQMKCSVNCGSISLVLINDSLSSSPEEFYDMIGIRVYSFECELGRKECGEEFLSLSLGKIFVVDLGKDGRCERMNYPQNGTPEVLDSLSVLVEGYNTHQLSIALESSIDSHLVIKIDRDPGAAGDVSIVIIISFLSITLFREPIQDLLSFLTCKWTSDTSSSKCESITLLPDEASNTETSRNKSAGRSFWGSSEIKIRFVAHYARFVFAADELDSHSRSLMMTG